MYAGISIGVDLKAADIVAGIEAARTGQQAHTGNRRILLDHVNRGIQAIKCQG